MKVFSTFFFFLTMEGLTGNILHLVLATFQSFCAYDSSHQSPTSISGNFRITPSALAKHSQSNNRWIILLAVCFGLNIKLLITLSSLKLKNTLLYCLNLKYLMVIKPTKSLKLQIPQKITNNKFIRHIENYLMYVWLHSGGED